MQLSDKYKRRAELEADVIWLEEQIRINRSRIGLKGTDYDKVNVQGGKRENYTENLLIKICDLEADKDFILQEIEALTRCINSYKAIASEFGNEYLEIIELKEKGQPRYIIADKINLSEATVQRRLEKLGLVEKRK